MNGDVRAIEELHGRDPAVRLLSNSRHANRAETDRTRRRDQETAEQRRIAQLLGGNSTELGGQVGMRSVQRRVGGQLTRRTPAVAGPRAVHREVSAVARRLRFHEADWARAWTQPWNARHLRRPRESRPIRRRAVAGACIG
jgi:hypothetical protein